MKTQISLNYTLPLISFHYKDGDWTKLFLESLSVLIIDNSKLYIHIHTK